MGRRQAQIKIPDLEIYIVGVWPSKEEDPRKRQPNFDEVKERLYDINLSDKTVDHEKVAVIVSDYIDIIKQLTDGAPQKKVNSMNDMPAKSRGRDGKPRKYGIPGTRKNKCIKCNQNRMQG